MRCSCGAREVSGSWPMNRFHRFSRLFQKGDVVDEAGLAGAHGGRRASSRTRSGSGAPSCRDRRPRRSPRRARRYEVAARVASSWLASLAGRRPGRAPRRGGGESPRPACAHRRRGRRCARRAPGRPARARSRRLRVESEKSRSRAMRRMTATCCRSFRPKNATSGWTWRKSFATTVATPRKWPGRAAPSPPSETSGDLDGGGKARRVELAGVGQEEQVHALAPRGSAASSRSRRG